MCTRMHIASCTQMGRWSYTSPSSLEAPDGQGHKQLGLGEGESRAQQAFWKLASSLWLIRSGYGWSTQVLAQKPLTAIQKSVGIAVIQRA